MGSKKYASVVEMVRDIAEDEKTVGDVESAIEQRQVIRHLMAIRATKGMSQADVADKLECSQSRISKMEGALDNDIKLGDFRAYAEAVGCELKCTPVSRDISAVDMVKGHTFAIRRHLDDLAELARTDEKIAEGVAKFFGEVLVNVILQVGGAIHSLPERARGTRYPGMEDENDAPTENCASDKVGSRSVGSVNT